MTLHEELHNPVSTIYRVHKWLDSAESGLVNVHHYMHLIDIYSHCIGAEGWQNYSANEEVVS